VFDSLCNVCMYDTEHVGLGSSRISRASPHQGGLTNESADGCHSDEAIFPQGEEAGGTGGLHPYTVSVGSS